MSPATPDTQAPKAAMPANHTPRRTRREGTDASSAAKPSVADDVSAGRDALRESEVIDGDGGAP
jgi:hypothetical protein